MAAFQTGLPGLSVVSHVIMELSNEIDRAPIHPLQTVENNAKDVLRKHKYAPMKCARDKVNVYWFSLMNDRCTSGASNLEQT